VSSADGCESRDQPGPGSSPQAHSPHGIFRRNHHERMAHLNQEKAPGLPTPESAARVIVQADSASRPPRTRYKIGLAPRLMPKTYRALPERLRDTFRAGQFPRELS
jgi:hypothetical protein